jgi:hypothetical protein
MGPRPLPSARMTGYDRWVLTDSTHSLDTGSVQVDSVTPEPNLVRTMTIIGRRTRGYTINVYREERGVRLVRRGRYRRLTVGTMSVEWYPA